MLRAAANVAACALPGFLFLQRIAPVRQREVNLAPGAAESAQQP